MGPKPQARAHRRPGDLAGVGCMVLPHAYRSTCEAAIGSSGYPDGGVLEARVDAVVQKGHSVAAVVHVLAVAARHDAKLLHHDVRPVAQHRHLPPNYEQHLAKSITLEKNIWSASQ